MKQPSLSAAGLAVVAAFALAACSKAPDVPAPAAPSVAPTPVAAKPAPQAASDHAEAGIAWREASSDADVDAAFAVARAETKPVFVYWGAKWCPPCNQVKATLFNRQDFIERSRAFVAVSVDGDSPGAQKLGTRFRVSGYPTMVLFKPNGEEVTRLPGEVDPARYSGLLNLGMNATRPVKAVLADALAGGKDLKANDWRLLAFYSWETDQTQVVAKNQVATTLAKLAAACPADQPETAMRLRLKALAAREAKTPAPADLAARPAVLAALADPAASRDVADQLVNFAPEIARALAAPATPERTQVVAALDTALQRLEADKTLSRADRMQALISRVELVRLDVPEDPPASSGKPAPLPQMPEALLVHVREEAARADREITDGYERQAVVTSAAHLLGQAGLLSEADKLLEANLAKSHSPYYLMLGLASNARKRGDKAGALRWYREAYEKSEGPATRMQWGAGYLSALVDLAPADEAAIEATTLQFWREAAPLPDAFEQRSGRAMQKVGNKLQAWNKGGAHGASMARLRGELDTVCTTQVKAEADRATCKALLTPAPKASA
ncbi:MAG: thioredoxin family protein [Burkholderiales bacterium]|nr:thioredoxin family protein [Burkholderiales bacterium]